MNRTLPGLFLLWLAAASTAAVTFTVTNAADSGAGSLRQAILDANASPGLDMIAFNIIGSGVHTISPTSPFPTITGPVIIDGYTQPGSAANTLVVGNDATLLIEINGIGLSGDLFVINGGGGSTVRGLVVIGVPAQSFNIQGSSANTLAGNFLGTNPAPEGRWPFSSRKPSTCNDRCGPLAGFQ